MSFFLCVEFWINRYQTLIVGLTAIAGVYYATQPVWQQLSAIEKQQLAEARGRLLTQYNMIKKTIDLFVGTWDAIKGIPQVTGDEPVAEYSNLMVQALKERKQRIRDLESRLATADLAPDEDVIVREAIATMLLRIGGCEDGLQTTIEKGEGTSLSELWFWGADQPDRDFTAISIQTRQKLAEAQKGIVTELAKTS